MKVTRLALALASALLAEAASAQVVLTSDLASGIPVGLAVPNTVAGADEPTAVSVNPGGLGFVGGATLQYFFEDGQGGSTIGNGVYGAVPIGPFVPALSLEWMSPASGPRYLKTELALAFDLGEVLAVGYGFDFYSSSGTSLGGLFDMDLGFTLRPNRFLSLGAAMLGFAGRVEGQPVTVRYNFGAAVRPFDLFAISGDLYANDGGRGVFGLDQGAATVSVPLPLGLSARGQYLFPLRSDLPAARRAQAVELALAFDLPHFGVTAAGQAFGSDLHDGSGSLYGIRVSAERYRSIDVPKKVEVLDLEEELKAPSPLDLLLGKARDRYGTLLRKLRRIEEDPSVSGLLLLVGSVPVGLGRTEELRHAVRHLSERKPVVAFLSALGGTKAYWLGSGATEVYAAPGSVVVANGLAATSFFLKGVLAKLGVGFEAVAVGRYKNAPDALTRSEPTEAQREVTASLLDAQFGLLAASIAESRRLPEARVRELLDVGVFSSEEARKASLLDGTLWPDEAEARARTLAGGGIVDRGVDESARRAGDRWGPVPYVALIPVEGTIAAGSSRREPFTGSPIAGSDTVVELIRGAASDPRARAIVLRVDSPGGDAFASDLLWHAVKEARRAGKPVVASMADVAASGGYLASVGADAIVAEPATLTGSIGVFAVKPDLSGLLEKLGVGLYAQQRGENARIDSPFKAWSPEERALVERQLHTFYDEFLDKVAEGRKLPRDEAERAAEGRVFTGAQALSRKLVDRLGGEDDAVRLAKELAGLGPGEDVEVRRLEADTGLFGALARGLSASPDPLQSALARVPEVQAAALLGELGTVLALPTAWLSSPPP